MYTLLKFLGWGILLAVVGGCIGWALRALTARSELARARSADVDAAEFERMRDRLADFDQVVAERDRLRMQIADMRHTDSPGVVGAAPADDDSLPTDATSPPAADPHADDQAADRDAVNADRDGNGDEDDGGGDDGDEDR